jgi:DNA-binding SARP family transcriptional activator
MRVELLGQPALVGSNGRRVAVTAPRPAALLAALALEHPRPLHRSELVELLWPDDKPADPPHAVRHVVSRARALLVAVGESGDMLVSAEGNTSLRCEHVEVDALEAFDSVAASERSLAAGDAVTARAKATEALTALERDLAVGERPYFVLWQERLTGAGRRARVAAAAAELALDDPLSVRPGRAGRGP